MIYQYSRSNRDHESMLDPSHGTNSLLFYLHTLEMTKTMTCPWEMVSPGDDLSRRKKTLKCENKKTLEVGSRFSVASELKIRR
jgi:hypothetical protein